MNAHLRGRLAAELRTDNNKPIFSFPLAEGDGVTETGFTREFRWKGRGLGDCPEKEVRGLFELEGAGLFTFEPDAKAAR